MAGDCHWLPTLSRKLIKIIIYKKKVSCSLWWLPGWVNIFRSVAAGMQDWILRCGLGLYVIISVLYNLYYVALYLMKPHNAHWWRQTPIAVPCRPRRPRIWPSSRRLPCALWNWQSTWSSNTASSAVLSCPTESPIDWTGCPRSCSCRPGRCPPLGREIPRMQCTGARLIGLRLGSTSDDHVLSMMTTTMMMI